MIFGGAGAGTAVASAFGGGCEKGRTMAESSESSTAMLLDGVVGCASGVRGAGAWVRFWRSRSPRCAHISRNTDSMYVRTLDFA